MCFLIKLLVIDMNKKESLSKKIENIKHSLGKKPSTELKNVKFNLINSLSELINETQKIVHEEQCLMYAIGILDISSNLPEDISKKIKNYHNDIIDLNKRKKFLMWLNKFKELKKLEKELNFLNRTIEIEVKNFDDHILESGIDGFIPDKLNPNSYQTCKKCKAIFIMHGEGKISHSENSPHFDGDWDKLPPKCDEAQKLLVMTEALD